MGFATYRERTKKQFANYKLIEYWNIGGPLAVIVLGVVYLMW